jgi:hypothetical protein
MDIKILLVEIDKDTLEPTLLITAEIEYFESYEMPLFINGKVKAEGGKTISFFNEMQVTVHQKNDFHLRMLSTAAVQNMFHSGNRDRRQHKVKLVAPLSQRAVEHIEQMREKNHEKSALIYFEFLTKHMQLPFYPKSADSLKNTEGNFISIEIKHHYLSFTIKQSDWVNNYAPALGVGNFLLLEFKIPQKLKVGSDFAVMYDKLYQRTREMEQAIRASDWKGTMNIARRFYENIKFRGKRQPEKVLEEKLRALFQKDNHTKDGTTDFIEAIFHYHQFISKYIHEKDFETNFMPDVIPTKEDAYFAFTHAVALLNVIGKKVNKDFTD